MEILKDVYTCKYMLLYARMLHFVRRTKVAIGQFAGAVDESEMGEINAEVRAKLATFRKKLDRLRLLARKQARLKTEIIHRGNTK